MGTNQLAQYRAKVSGGREVQFRLAGAPTSGAGGTYVNMAGLGSLWSITLTPSYTLRRLWVAAQSRGPWSDYRHKTGD
jgi:hypothetical protein